MAGMTRITGVLMTCLLCPVAFGQDPASAQEKPGTAEGWYKSAYDKRHNKDLDGAIADAGEAIKLSPKTGKYWLERGISRGGKGDLDGALSDFNQAVLLAPENADALRIRGLMKGRMKDFDAAIEDFGAAVRISPKFSRAYGDRGDTYRQMGKIDLALASYNQALELDTKYFWFCESRGDILRSQGKSDQAASDYRSALETVKDEAVRTRLQRKLAALANAAPAAVPVAGQEKRKEDFEKENPKWTFPSGKWERRKSGESMVLAQTAETQPWAVAILEDQKYSDIDVTVKFRPVSGKEDASGGILFRAKDGKNYFIVRANALEDNFRLYTMKEGSRGQLASAKVDPPKLGQWSTIRVVAKGSKIQAYLNGKLHIDHDDKTYTEGWVGLWTKADSVTEFDDLELSGTASK